MINSPAQYEVGQLSIKDLVHRKLVCDFGRVKLRLHSLNFYVSKVLKQNRSITKSELDTLELTTHAVFAFAVGLLFFGRVDIAFLVMLGALVPDLDREYWFVQVKKYQDEQPHRARFHNVFVMAAGYLLSPFFALGIFLRCTTGFFSNRQR